MNATNLSPSEAAKQLGVSAKALRLYEARGLIAPVRTEAGWRTYGSSEMERAAEIVSWRKLGLSLAQVADVLDGDTQSLEPILAAHQTALETKLQELTGTLNDVRRVCANLANGQTPRPQELSHLLEPARGPCASFDLPWPWGGEQFELNRIEQINYIIGPLGSGKTRLAQRLAEKLSNAAFVSLDRPSTPLQPDLAPDIKARVDRALDWIIDEGGTASSALIALLTVLETDGPDIFVVDMLEQDLDQTTQEALIAYLRCRAPDASPLFILTRSSSILDLSSITADEAIILCPANHSPPMLVAPYPGAPGYEAVATCLASPDVRRRTEGVIAMRPKAG